MYGGTTLERGDWDGSRYGMGMGGEMGEEMGGESGEKVGG